MPVTETFKNFQDEFVDIFKNIHTSDIKSMAYLNEEEKIKFDFIFNNQEFINPLFFEEERNFDKSMPRKNKLEFLINFIEEVFGVLTPKILKYIFEHSKIILTVLVFNMKDLDLTESDYEEMIYLNFNKYQINLNDEKDKNLFKNFLINDFQLGNFYIETENKPSSMKKESNNRLQDQETLPLHLF